MYLGISLIIFPHLANKPAQNNVCVTLCHKTFGPLWFVRSKFHEFCLERLFWARNSNAETHKIVSQFNSYSSDSALQFKNIIWTSVLMKWLVLVHIIQYKVKLWYILLVALKLSYFLKINSKHWKCSKCASQQKISILLHSTHCLHRAW
jgi:hypothetical protein